MEEVRNSNLRKKFSGRWRQYVTSLGSFLLLFTIISIEINAQGEHIVSGKILENGGETLVGVTVMEEGGTNGTVSDVNGHYSLKVKENSVLVYSFIGFKTEKIYVQGRSEIDVTLVSNIEELGEVVVIAYGTTSSKNFTGSTTQIKTSNSPLADIPVSDAMGLLKGTVPGMAVSQEQGAGQSSSLLVRGQRSINGDGSPLIVLDGVVFMGAMRDIDPSSIESISVLKDATSVAAYGSRAANGVVMISTKKGQYGKPVISFNTSYGISRVINKADVLSPEKWVEKVNLLQGLDANADPTSWMSDFEDENYANGTTTDWQDLVERTGAVQKYNLSISGAKEDLDYYFSGSYNKTEGVLIGDDYNRKALTSRLNTNITDWLVVGTNVNFTYNDYSGPSTYNIYEAIRLTPYGRVYREGSNSLLEKYPATEGLYRVNPLWSVNSGTIDDHDVYYTTILGGHAIVKCPWIDGLQYRVNYNYTIKNIERDYFTHEGYYVGEGTSSDRYSPAALSDFLTSANGYSARERDLAYVWDNILSYSANFGYHKLDVTAVYTRDSYDSQSKTFTGSNFSDLGNTTLGFNGLALATTQKISSIYNSVKTNIGYLGRISYSYKGKYHLNASVRRDGASVFGSDNKWGTFPSIGLGWTLSSENFMRSLDAINFLKLKFSLGKNGNQALSPYQTLSFITLGQTGGFSYPFGNNSEVSWGQRVSDIGNTSLKWEETTALNAGFELIMYDSKVNLDFDTYYSKTQDQIFSRTIPIMANGFNSIDATMGQVDNWGIEAALNTKNVEAGNFKWNSTLNFYLNRNKLKDLYGDGLDDISNNLFLGKSLGAIYGYKPVGIVQEEDTEYKSVNGAVNGDVKFWDKSGDGTIGSEDKTILGYSKENFRMSFANTFDYKNFELYALVTGIFGGNGYYQQTNIYAYRTASDVVYDNNLNHGWYTDENRSNKYPRVGYSDSRYTPVQSRGFVRLQNLNLSYRFKQSWVDRMNIQSLKVFFAATNIFTVTGWEGGDPETGQTLGSGYSYGYPLSSIYSVGVDLKF